MYIDFSIVIGDWYVKIDCSVNINEEFSSTIIIKLHFVFMGYFEAQFLGWSFLTLLAEFVLLVGHFN